MVRCGDTMYCLVDSCQTMVRFGEQCIVWWTWVRTMVRCGDTVYCLVTLVDMGTNYGTAWRYNAFSGGRGYEL